MLTNFYSVPLAEGEKVVVKVYASNVEAWQHGRCLARHERCFGRHQKVLELDHYLSRCCTSPARWQVRRPWSSAVLKVGGRLATTSFGSYSNRGMAAQQVRA